MACNDNYHACAATPFDSRNRMLRILQVTHDVSGTLSGPLAFLGTQGSSP
jgi:hypothetical protein